MINNLLSQNDTAGLNKLLEMSLEELMNVEVKIASKTSEKLYEAPLSAAVVTKQEIINSGASSIQEIFRLIPGFIVREQTNGIYDIHILGYDYSNPRSSMPYASNLISLVMIDNRVVFRDFQGGTFWETLPVDINDIDKIEIVRGPASALYGPNAVNGVINIITKRANKQGFTADVSGQYGNFSSLLTNGNIGFKKNKFSINISGNLQKRDRYQSNYCEIFSGTYVAHPDSIRNVQTGKPNAFKLTGNTRYPNFSNAVDKYAINGYLNFEIDKSNFVDLSFGTQNSEVQKIYVDVTHTAFTTEKSQSSYANLRTNLYGFSLQASYLQGYQNTLGVIGWEYDHTNIDANLEYNFKISDNIRIMPGVSYRDVVFDDAVGVENTGVGFINGKYNLNTLAASLKNDFIFFRKLRFVAALRADKYNYPQKIYFSYNLALTFKPNEKNIIRLNVSRANKGANILDTYINYNFKNFLVYSGNKNLNLMTLNLYEIGYRYLITENLHFAAQANYSNAKDYTIISVLDSIVPNSSSPYGITQYFNSSNISVNPNQISAGISINYVPSAKLHIKPTVTYIKSELKNYDYYFDENQKDSLITIENSWSPKFFGGLYLNYKPINNLNINLNSYFFTKGTFNYLFDKSFEVKDQIILNFRVSYTIAKYFTLFANVRNINLMKSSAQFAFADIIKPMYFVGLQINY